ncbi:MAG: T9SS type A sorting domain-containing protein [Bacteroidia bacterium]
MLKRIFTFCFILFVSVNVHATLYYFDGSGALTAVGNWWTNTNGTGSNPTNFTTAGNQFNIRNTAAVSLTAAWTVSGAGSGVTIGDGVTGTNFTIPSGTNLLTGNILNVYANSTLTITNNTNLKPTLTTCTFDAASTVVYNNSASTTIQVPVGSTYGTLVISGTGGAGTTYTMNGALTIGTLSLTTAPKLLLNSTGTNRTFDITDYYQSAGTLDGGSSNTGDANFTVYVNISGSFTKTAGTIDNTSPAQYTCFQYNGNVAETFSTAGTDNYMFVHVAGTTSLTLNSALSLNGSSTQSKTTFTLDAGATITCGTNLITNSSTGTSTNLINGTFQTAAPSGFSGGAATAIKSSNAPTITLGAASTIEYNANGVAQTVTTRTDYANVTITNNSTKTMVGGNTLSGDLTINATATLAAGNFTHIIKGDFLNSGTFTSNNSTMHFNGAGTNQNIGPAGGSTTTFYILRINNASGVTLLKDANVSNTLTLSNGLLNTSATPNGLLFMQSGSAAPALTDASTSYVNGPLAYMASANTVNTTINIPIGASPDCRPLQLTVNNTDNTVYTYLCQSYNANAEDLGYTLPATCDTISNVHYWTVGRYIGTTNTPSAGINGNQSIRIYFGTNDYVYQGGNLAIVKNTAAAPTTWFDIGGSCSFAGNFATPQAGYVTSTSSPSAFTSFSTFSLGSKLAGWNSLPISLLSFSAVPDGNKKVDLNWTTQTEVNNKYFTVERSADGQNFTELENVTSKAPHGNSNKKLTYKLTDHSPLSGVSYYRLKQTDYNGKSESFNTVNVSLSNAGIQFMVYPNPNSGEFKADFSGIENNHEVQITMVDVHGKLVYSSTFYAQEANNTINIIPDTKIGKGIYFCSLIAEGIKHTVKVMVN